MPALQSQALLSSESSAMDQLQAFLRQRREAPTAVEDLERFEHEVHRFFVAAEREALGQELARFDIDVPQGEVAGERYNRVLRCETTSNSAAGPGRVARSLYRSVRGGDAICPLGTSPRDHRGFLDLPGSEAGHLGRIAFAPPRKRRTF